MECIRGSGGAGGKREDKRRRENGSVGHRSLQSKAHASDEQSQRHQSQAHNRKVTRTQRREGKAEEEARGEQA
jgi:hypothetical protein